MPNAERPVQNTDRELWREPHPDPPGDYYANSIHVTAQGGIGINIGGTVIVRTLAQWHALVIEPDGQLRAKSRPECKDCPEWCCVDECEYPSDEQAIAALIVKENAK